MKRLDNSGFTLIELVATIVILSLVMGIGAFSITKIIDNSKEKDYKLLIKNIKDAAELYYQECKYGGISKDGTYKCDKLGEGITLGNLVEFGYLTGNSKINEGNDKNKYTLINPNNGKSITSCDIKIKYDTTSGKVVVSTDEPAEIRDAVTNEIVKNPCPTSY